MAIIGHYCKRTYYDNTQFHLVFDRPEKILNKIKDRVALTIIGMKLYNHLSSCYAIIARVNLYNFQFILILTICFEIKR